MTISGPHCPYCGSDQVGRVRGLQGPFEVFTGMVLLVAGLIPGIIFYVIREGMPYCATCGRRVWKADLRVDRRPVK